MSTVDYSLFLPDVNLSTTACPEFERINQIRNAAQDFCRRSFMWRVRELALFTTVAGQESYDITAVIPADAQLVGVHSAWANGREVDVEEPGEVDDYAPGTQGRVDCGWPRCVIGIDGPGALRATPAPDSGGIAITGTLSFAPSDAATGVPDFIFNRWRREIASGAIEILCAQEGKPWSNPGLAAFHKNKFDAAVMLAGSRAGPVRRKGLRVQMQDAGPAWYCRRS